MVQLDRLIRLSFVAKAVDISLVKVSKVSIEMV